MYFFDLDGTLLDSNGIWLDIDLEFLGQHGVSPVPPDYTDYVTHHNFEDSAEYTRQRLGLEMAPGEIIAAWQELAREAYTQQLELKPGARDFLERAMADNIRCALLTSCIPDLCHAALARHQLTPFFEAILTTAELGLEKRDPALYRTLAQRFDLANGDCVLFDDSPVYCAAAKEAGWQVFGMADPVFDDRAEEMAALCAPGRFPFSFLQPIP